ncbi:curli assembly protein CsgF [Histidinibacterium aquaticum]|uniref:Curli production assembly/transport component CsgF n=1 Tax=Histidinibacterium aquaticum TaxID=2613962 RepID=A0A5J5GAE1_9RHOB|nr:curli assembly protein CsgF [Histidinibacterium aquaticum]KAA9005077.1 hypothetical protein F3S47_18790 [Histidinibacterium aquaticum]
MNVKLFTTFAVVGALTCGAAAAENRNFNFINPNFGGNPNIGTFLFGLAEVQRTATIDPDELQGGGGGGQAPTPGVGGGGNIGGPTIIIPIGNTGVEVPQVGVGTED